MSTIAGPWNYISDREMLKEYSRVVVAASKVGVVCDSLRSSSPRISVRGLTAHAYVAYCGHIQAVGVTDSRTNGTNCTAL